MIDILARTNSSLSNLRKSLPQSFSTPEIRIECYDEEKFKIVETLKNKLEKDGIEFNNVDGIRCDSEIGWWLIRASNTQAVLVARCEADSPENLKKLKNTICQQLIMLNIKIPQELL
jgi:phosphomannomutase